MNGYSVEIKYTSKELSAREKIAMKDVTNATRLDEATAEQGKVVITPDFIVELAIHNEKSDNKDYDNYLIIDKSGEKFVTGSQTFWNSFMGIWNEMCDENEEWSVEAYRVPSKNYKGKDFLTCSII